MSGAADIVIIELYMLIVFSLFFSIHYFLLPSDILAACKFFSTARINLSFYVVVSHIVSHR